MNKLMQLVQRAPKRVGALIAIIAAVIIVPAGLNAWGPSRATFTTANPADYITFNSIVDNPSHGDERNFMQVREANASNETYADSIELQPGKEYVVYMYYHNNAAENLNLVATNSQARAELPAVVPNGSNGTAANGYISADNAKPKQVWDDIEFKNHSGGDIALRYVPGSTTIHSKGAVNGKTMSDSIVTSGAKLGYNSLDGKVPGCNEFAGYVTFRVKADQPNFTVSKKVRQTGTSEWKESTAVNPGQSVDYLIEYKNTGTTDQNDVVLKDQLPKNMEYVKGSTKLANANNPSGKSVADGIATGGLNVGDYKPGANAIVMFSAKAPANDKLDKCGFNVLTNKASAITKNGTKSDTADITVDKTCEQPKPVYACDSLTAKKIGTNQYSFNGSATAKNGAEITKYTLEFGDGQTFSGSSLKDVKHTYPADGKTYTAKLSVTVKVDGSTKTVTSDNCKVTIKTEKPPVVVKDIKVCELATKKVITIKEDQFDSSKHSKNLDDCKPKPVEKIEVCDLTTRKVVQINKDDFDAKKYSKDLGDCKKIEVCELDSKKIVKIYKDGFDAERHSKDLTDCDVTPEEPEEPEVPEQPEQPEEPKQPEQPKEDQPKKEVATELPQTGVAAQVGSLVGVGSLVAAFSYYVISRRSL